MPCGVILCYLWCYAVINRKEQQSFFYLSNLIPLRMNSWSSSNCGYILCYSAMLCNRHFLYKYLKGSLSVSCDPLDFYHALKTDSTGSNPAPAPIVVLFCGILWCYATSTSCLWEPPRAVISAQEQEQLIGRISVKISSNEIFELSNDHNI